MLTTLPFKNITPQRIFGKYVIAATMLCILVACGDSSTLQTPATDPTQNNPDTENPSGTPPDTNTAITIGDKTIAAIPASLPQGVSFDNTAIKEASGLQRSAVIPGVYYTHNDSGHDPVVYVTDASGQDLAQITLPPSASTADWEAIAGTTINEVPHLIVADVGNNDRQRTDLKLLVFPEPTLTTLQQDQQPTIPAPQTISVSFSDGLGHDTESVLVNDDQLIMITKNPQDTTAQEIWSASISNAIAQNAVIMEYRNTIALSSKAQVNAITDIDIHPNGREIAVLVYGPNTAGKVYFWQASENASETLTELVSQPAVADISAPLLNLNFQAEGISYSADGEQILIAAESGSRSTLTLLAR